MIEQFRAFSLIASNKKTNRFIRGLISSRSCPRKYFKFFSSALNLWPYTITNEIYLWDWEALGEGNPNHFHPKPN